MSEYTSTREGFQHAMKISLTGPPEETDAYVQATTVTGFYHVMNGQRFEDDSYLQHIKDWRARSTEYKPVIEEFVRDGDQLAARMTGTMKVDGEETKFESFMFATVEKETGKMVKLIERAVWGPVGKEYEHGVNM